jgi:hypothetical protein
MAKRVCEHRALVAIGSLARKKAPPVVPASSIGSWYWCRLKAWHSVSLFNTGWLSLEELGEEELAGLVVLWAAELWKKGRERIITGRIIHGESASDAISEALTGPQIAEILLREGGEAFEKLLENGVVSMGLIDPREYEEQLKKYNEAADIVEYFRREEWPMIGRRAPRGYMVIGVPDSIEYSRGGLRVAELKTSSKPWLVRRHSRSYLAAKAQLAAYTWILVEKWPLEEAVLVFKDVAGRTFLVERFVPEDLAEWFEKNGLAVADELASLEPPRPSDRAPCRSCEYGNIDPVFLRTS